MRQYTFLGFEIHVRCLIRSDLFKRYFVPFLYPFFMGYAQFSFAQTRYCFMLLYIFVVFNLTHVCLPPMNDHPQWILRNKFYSMHIEAHSSEPLVNLKMKRTIPRRFFFPPIKNWYWFISLYQCQLRLHTIEPVDSCLGCFTVIISDCGFSFWPTSVFVFVDPNFWFTSSLVSLPWKKQTMWLFCN